MNSKNKFVFAIVGIALVVIFWIGWVSTSGDSKDSGLVVFLSIDELIDDEVTTRVKLGGLVQDGSIVVSDQDLLDADFILLQDEATLAVRYHGTRPDLFKDGAEVIVEGLLKGDIFYADQLQTKCASRYEGDLRDESNYSTEEI